MPLKRLDWIALDCPPRALASQRPAAPARAARTTWQLAMVYASPSRALLIIWVLPQVAVRSGGSFGTGAQR